MDVLARGSACRSFNDVARGGDCRTTNLGLKSVALVGRKRLGSSVNIEHQWIGLVEDIEFAMIAAHTDTRFNRRAAYGREPGAGSREPTIPSSRALRRGSPTAGRPR